MALLKTAQTMLCQESKIPIGFLEALKGKFPEVPDPDVICADEEFSKDCRSATIVSLKSGLETASRTIIPKLNSSAQKAGRNVFDAFTVSRP